MTCIDFRINVSGSKFLGAAIQDCLVLKVFKPIMLLVFVCTCIDPFGKFKVWVVMYRSVTNLVIGGGSLRVK